MKKLNWDLYLITEEKLSAGRSTLEVVREAVNGGVDVIQLREKNLPLRERFRLGQKIKKITEQTDIDFIVNDRVDLALALDADGVHLGQSDLPLIEARRILGEDKIIGISGHTFKEIELAERDGADYLGVGAVFSTDSKQVDSSKDGIGPAGITKISEKSNLPIIAIGGLNKDNCCQVIESGADTISVISAITKAANISEETKIFKDKIISAKRGAIKNGIN